MLMGLAWGIGVVISKSLNQNIRHLNKFLLFQFVFCWIGAKIFFLLTSDFINKEEFIQSSNFWLGGGFVFYGGLLFGLLGTYGFLKITNQKMNDLSFMVIPLGIGHGIGRVGCFLAGCCHGSMIEFDTVTLHTPVQIMEALGLLLIARICFTKFKQNINPFTFYLKAYALLRFTLEFLRGDDIRGIYWGLSTSQFISLGILSAALLIEKRNRIEVDKC